MDPPHPTRTAGSPGPSVLSTPAARRSHTQGRAYFRRETAQEPRAPGLGSPTAAWQVLPASAWAEGWPALPGEAGV